MTPTERVIMHFDIDAFFAAVEVLLNPELAGKPVIVGGSDKRGVVATASYEARKFGIHSAMSSVVAKRLCPDAIFISGNFEAYKKYSRMVFEIMSEATPVLEKVGIDEGYMEITDPSIDPVLLALTLKEKVKQKTGLTISIGISYNKFLAKLASDWQKPDGLFQIKPDQVESLLSPLPILKIHGLGKKSAEKLNAVGIFTVKDLLALQKEHLAYFMGVSWGEEIYDRIRGIDNRPLVTYYERKSYGRETTLEVDVVDLNYLFEILTQYSEKLLNELVKKGLKTKTVTLKVTFSDFHKITRSHSLDAHTDSLTILNQTLHSLLMGIEKGRPVRLIGVTFSNLIETEAVQLSLLDQFD